MHHIKGKSSPLTRIHYEIFCSESNFPLNIQNDLFSSGSGHRNETTMFFKTYHKAIGYFTSHRQYPNTMKGI